MRTVKARPLTLESFSPYGQFADLLHPEGEKIGELPVAFYRDMVSVFTGEQVTSFSVVLTSKRAMVPEDAEQHVAGTEVLIPLDGDIVVFAAPATDRVYPAGKEEAFVVPKGTMVAFRLGVWHKAPFPVDRETVSTVVVLPEREYARDCVVIPLEGDARFAIEL